MSNNGVWKQSANGKQKSYYVNGIKVLTSSTYNNNIKLTLIGTNTGTSSISFNIYNEYIESVDISNIIVDNDHYKSNVIISYDINSNKLTAIPTNKYNNEIIKKLWELKNSNFDGYCLDDKTKQGLINLLNNDKNFIYFN